MTPEQFAELNQHVAEANRYCDRMDAEAILPFDHEATRAMTEVVEALKLISAASAVVHLSHRLHPEYTMCGIDFTPAIKRTPKVRDVTCAECLAVEKAAKDAAEPEPDGYIYEFHGPTGGVHQSLDAAPYNGGEPFRSVPYWIQPVEPQKP